MEGSASALSTFLESVGTVGTTIISWVGQIGNTVVSTPVLLVPVAIGIFAGAVTFFKKLRH